VYEYLVKIFSALETDPFLVKGKSIPVTLSAGATFYRCVLPCKSPLDENSYVEKYMELQQEADDALYEAKYMGKANFRVYRPGRRDYYETCRRHYSG
jgi:GGDEF domain-containing protein